MTESPTLFATVQNLDADIEAKEMRSARRRSGAQGFGYAPHISWSRCFLEDRLESIEKMRSRGYGGQANSLFLALAPHRISLWEENV